MAGQIGEVWVELAAGPYFDDLTVGSRFTGAPGVTLTEGMAAVHQAILGSRLRLPLDHALCASVTGRSPIAHPALVWDTAIGQSTVVTHRVKANLFYRGLAFHRYPVLGDTLRTVTEVAGLRENTRKPGRAPTGLAALRITTIDQEERPVLDFWRCAMLPLRSGSRETGHCDDFSTLGATPPAPPLSGWDLARFRMAFPGEHFDAMKVGRKWRVTGADVVSAAPELARLTVNIAMAHHDAQSTGTRLVYGGHTIGIALAQASRAIPNIVTVANWVSCDHVGPVHEDDSLTSEIEVTGREPLPDGGGLVQLRSIVDAAPSRRVLDFRFAVVLA